MGQSAMKKAARRGGFDALSVRSGSAIMQRSDAAQ